MNSLINKFTFTINRDFLITIFDQNSYALTGVNRMTVVKTKKQI